MNPQKKDEKGKIKGISHTEKVLWLKLEVNNKALKIVHEIISKFNDNIGLEQFDDNLGNYLPLEYKYYQNTDYRFFEEEESLFLVFTETHINVILLKDSKLFNKLEKEFMDHFEFIEPKEELMRKQK
ncbi:hypothetical protein HYW74_04025 [Candidatus Pacearchaeota archaeon]|nr:hypothetical protein [Candidatus Pacearchaeota archaeon]